MYVGRILAIKRIKDKLGRKSMEQIDHNPAYITNPHTSSIIIVEYNKRKITKGTSD